jgi:hypothetical protein
MHKLIMASHTVIKNINAFVVDFLIAHCSSEVVEQWNSKQNQKRYKKKLKTKKRRGGKPKRAKTAYLYFCIDPDNRAEAKNRLDDEAKNTDVVREVAKMWNKLKTSDDDDDIARKTRYHELASKDKERYDDEKHSCSSSAEADEDAIKKKPKRAKTAYLYFCIDPDNRAEAKSRMDDDAKNTDVVREVAKMWNKLKTSDDDDDIARKTRYHELASKDKERYDDEKQSCSPVVPKVNRSIVRVKSSTGYRSFIKNRKEFISNETPDAKNVMAIIKEEWNTMSEEEKQSWEASVGVVAGAVPY